VGLSQGRKVFTLRTLPERDPYESSTSTAGKVAGFSLHAGVAAKAQQRDKLERLCRYITRPALSEKRLSLTAQGNIRYRLAAPAHPCARGIRACMHIKTPYRDGTTHVVFEPLDFIARLAALVPAAPAHPCARGIRTSMYVKPRVNLTRFHGVFAPNSNLRSRVTPGSGAWHCRGDTAKTASEHHAAMSLKPSV
jgi:hypothetical protein